MPSAIDVLSAAVWAACLRDLPPREEHLEVDRAQERAYLNLLSDAGKRAYYRDSRVAMDAPTYKAFYQQRSIDVSILSSRPQPTACDVRLFKQTWLSTALGYGGLGGQAISEAYTVVVQCEHTGCAAVYFGGNRLAYLIPASKQGPVFHKCLAEQAFPSVQAAAAHGWYSAVRPGGGE